MYLFIDGNYIVKKNLSKASKPSDAIFTTISAIRKLVAQFFPERCVVFWDAEDGGIMRQRLLPEYKANRDGKSWSEKKNLSESEIREILMNRENIQHVKDRIMKYLTHLFVRQILVPEHEADDLIHFACSLYGEDKRVVVFTNDRDLSQVLYSAPKVEIIFDNSTIRDDEGGHVPYSVNTAHRILNMHPKNIKYFKTFNGDASDNIKAGHGVGNTILSKIFDPMKPIDSLECALSSITEFYEANPSKTSMSLNYCLFKSDIEALDSSKIAKDLKKNKYLCNKPEFKAVIDEIMGETRDDRYERIFKCISLGDMITEKAKDEVALALEAPLTLNDRGGKFLMNLMIGDSFLENIGLRARDSQPHNPMTKERFTYYTKEFLPLISKEKKYSSTFF